MRMRDWSSDVCSSVRASMENIARRCGKTKQLIYHYYGSKELLFADVVSKNHKNAVAELIAHDYEGLDPKAALRKFLLNIVDQYRRFPEWASLMLDENLHGGVHYGEREKIRAVTSPLFVQFRRLFDLGPSQRLVAAHISLEQLFSSSFYFNNKYFQ